MTNNPAGTSIQLLKSGLQELGYQSESFLLSNLHFTRFTAPHGGVWLTSDYRIAYPFASNTARPISTNKHLAYDLAQQLGVTVPFTTEITDMNQAESALTALTANAPLVVKPDAASLSNGLTLHVTTEADLRVALTKAAAFSPKVLVQEQIIGEEIRFVVIDGRVTAAILRQKPHVIGDGATTVAGLIDKENELRAQIQLPYTQYPPLDEKLINLKALNLDQVLADGERLELGQATMIRNGASMYNVLPSVDSSYIAIAEKLAQALGNGFVAVDIIMQDYTQPATIKNYAFIEFNMSPVLLVFYACRDGQQYNVLEDLVPLIDRSLKRNMA